MPRRPRSNQDRPRSTRRDRGLGWSGHLVRGAALGGLALTLVACSGGDGGTAAAPVAGTAPANTAGSVPLSNLAALGGKWTFPFACANPGRVPPPQGNAPTPTELGNRLGVFYPEGSPVVNPPDGDRNEIWIVNKSDAKAFVRLVAVKQGEGWMVETAEACPKS